MSDPDAARRLRGDPRNIEVRIGLEELARIVREVQQPPASE